MQTMLTPAMTAPRDLRSVALLIGSGLVNVTLVAWIACPFPLHAGAALPRILLTASVYLSFSVIAGVAICWTFWRYYRSEFLIEFKGLAIRAGVIWVFVPPTVFLIREGSLWACPIVVLMGGATAFYTRRLARVAVPDSLPSTSEQFSLLPNPSGGIWLALVVAICIEMAPFTAGFDFLSVSETGLMLGAAACVVVWRYETLRDVPSSQPGRRPASDLGAAIGVAFVLTVLALAALEERNGLIAGARHNPPPSGKPKTEEKATAPRIGEGYQGIILWNLPEKKEKVVIAPRLPSALDPNHPRPIVIPFDGPYWYFQPPHDNPGKRPHVDHGDPAKVNIRSLDYLPLLMEAHQTLAASVDLACCRELQMHVRNGDNHPGTVILGVILTDSTAPGKPSLSLGGTPVLSTQPERFAIKSTPLPETLHYTVPPRPRIHKFNEITVVFFPSPQHAQEGVKIGIQDFVLIPR